eukprot:COSAG05_NODE_2835_length_2585_cov_2.664521_1_plen_63_part_10
MRQLKDLSVSGTIYLVSPKFCPLASSSNNPEDAHTDRASASPSWSFAASEWPDLLLHRERSKR